MPTDALGFRYREENVFCVECDTPYSVTIDSDNDIVSKLPDMCYCCGNILDIRREK